MVNILGQNKILSAIDSFTIDNLPKAILLVGMSGSGKTLILKYLADKFNLNFIGLQTINQEIIENIYESIDQGVYNINIDLITPDEQSELLKIVDDQPVGKYFFLETSDINDVIDQLSTRCVIYTLELYDEDTLREFIIGDNDYPILIGKTPGDILKLNEVNIEELLGLCKSIILDKIDLYKAVELADIISVYDLNIFLKIMLEACFRDSGIISPEKMFRYMKISSDYLWLSRNKNLKQEILLSKYLLELVEVNNIEYKRS